MIGLLQSVSKGVSRSKSLLRSKERANRLGKERANRRNVHWSCALVPLLSVTARPQHTDTLVTLQPCASESPPSKDYYTCTVELRTDGGSVSVNCKLYTNRTRTQVSTGGNQRRGLQRFYAPTVWYNEVAHPGERTTGLHPTQAAQLGVQKTWTL